MDAGGKATGVNGNCDTGAGAYLWQSGGGQGNGGGGGGGAGYYGGGGAGFIWTYCSGGGAGGSSWSDPGNSASVLDGGDWQTQGNVTQSQGAGVGGMVFSTAAGTGADGRVEVAW